MRTGRGYALDDLVEICIDDGRHAFAFLALKDLRCNFGGVFDDLERFAGRVEDRVVGSLNPDFPSGDAGP